MNRADFINILQRNNGWRLWTSIFFIALLVVELIILVLDICLDGHVVYADLIKGFVAVLIVEPTHLMFMVFMLGEFSKREKRALELSAQLAESRLSVAIENSHMIIWEMDFIKGEISYNDTMLPLFGLPEGLFPYDLQSWVALIHPEDRAPFMAHFNNTVLPDGEDFNFEYRLILPDREVAWVHTRGRIIQRDASGLPILAVGSTLNITQKKQAEIALQEEKKQFELIFNNTPDLMIFSRHGRWEGEIWNQRKNGEIYPEHLTITAVRDEHGEVVNYVGALIDNTEQQKTLETLRNTATQLEMANAQIEEERARLAEHVEERTAQLQLANKAKDAFLATMSHEIRTPLGGLLGMMELLRLSKLTDEQQQCVVVAQKSGKSLLRIVDDILDWSKIEAGKLQLAPRTASVADMMQVVFDTYFQLASVKNIVLKLHIDSCIGEAYFFDPMRLSQILNNFTNNAIKFTAMGSIEIDAKVVAHHDDYDTLCFSVKDTGIGIEPQYLCRLFQHYEQVSANTARMYGGTGLGLSICQSLADLMEGEITVESSLRVGSIFRLTLNLPIAKLSESSAQANVGDRSGVYESVMIPLVASGHHVSVLVVDDHPVNRMLIKKQLDLLGFQVDAAADGIEALMLLADEKFDIIITDCHMPEMDGYELTRRIREKERENGAHVPIIAWTANVMSEEENRCYDAGMDDILTKPTELAEIRRKMSTWMGKTDRYHLLGPMQNQQAKLPDTNNSHRLCPIDLSVLSKVASSHAAQVEFFEEFDRQNVIDLDRLQRVLQLHDLEEIKKTAHRIKGASRMMGALELEDVCHRIEIAAAQGDLSGARTIADTLLAPTLERLQIATSKHINGV